MREPAATALVEALDLSQIPLCLMCFFDLAWAKHQGSVPRGLLGRTIRSVWPEIEDGVRAAVVAARMREVPHAEDALRDLDERGPRGLVARGVVDRVADELADEMADAA
jgi:hypothetical protein